MHCIFDMDGLLLDTEKFYTVAQEVVLSKYGRQFNWELKAQMMGRKALDAAQWLIDELDLQGQLTAEEFVQAREEILLKLFPTAELMPGADRLVRHLHAHKVPIAVATSSSKFNFDLKVTKHQELFGLFHHIVTGDMVTNSKPAPDIFLKAASSFEPAAAADNCLVFEDAPAGVTAGKAAKMTVVMVPDSNLEKAETRQADLVLSSLEEFRPQDFRLPAFSS